MGYNYVIEHLEADEVGTTPLPPWVELEYAHMRTLAGREAVVRFTHLSRSSCDHLTSVFATSTTAAAAEGLAQVICDTAGVMDLLERSGIPPAKVCLLDPKAEKALAPEDGDGDGDGGFEWFLFGGILGDDPPRDRTSELRSLGFPTRHLGPVQMTTDTALGVTKLVVCDKTPLDAIPYVDHPTIRFNAKESVEMPFRYIAASCVDPLLPPGMKELLQADLNKAFDI